MNNELKMAGTVQGRTLTVYIRGPLDAHTVPQAERALERTIEQHKVRRLVVSLEGLTYMSASAIRSLKSFERRQGFTFAVFHGERSSFVCAILDVTFAEPTIEEQLFLERVPLEVAA